MIHIRAFNDFSVRYQLKISITCPKGKVIKITIKIFRRSAKLAISGITGGTCRRVWNSPPGQRPNPKGAPLIPYGIRSCSATVPHSGTADPSHMCESKSLKKTLHGIQKSRMKRQLSSHVTCLFVETLYREDEAFSSNNCDDPKGYEVTYAKAPLAALAVATFG